MMHGTMNIEYFYLVAVKYLSKCCMKFKNWFTHKRFIVREKENLFIRHKRQI